MNCQIDLPPALMNPIKQSKQKWQLILSIREIGTIKSVPGQLVSTGRRRSRLSKTALISNAVVQRPQNSKAAKPAKNAKAAKPAQAAKAAKPARAQQARPQPFVPKAKFSKPPPPTGRRPPSRRQAAVMVAAEKLRIDSEMDKILSAFEPSANVNPKRVTGRVSRKGFTFRTGK